MKRINHYTLLEVIIVIPIFAIIGNATLYLYYQGQQATFSQQRQSELICSLDTLTSDWRRFAAHAGAVLECEPEKIIFTEGGEATFEHGRILLSCPDFQRAQALPNKYKARFRHEPEPQAAGRSLLILEIYEPGAKKNIRDERFFRIVAREGGAK
ncbi:MAG: hypothetical protein JXR78_02485 [Victivallales bacterium]|nr:hypothetical protein [Victivallales bacterium]